ncbi:MAG: bifunctional [glutamate--ammonia ligase]-adenylyl-L-tyrosine phosphorylase/[glutamate--ammonia-ligase] adenylyltransferase, partial [Pseudomonadota bacterium]|nr:bifunctional [glutamate--ammonia ligase]-adenylyl-L-tyrosine phosphorylase/[glutamate--ammonia-ligase] adenylyltransferase [Pseudomonadota bacterium]
ITEEGFVFRVDMRLRPYGHSGSLCSGFASLETYYQSQGREWERYALIKARVVYGERAHELMALLQPFVFRKYLDFGAFASMRNLYEQIQQEVLRRDQADNIKTGPGGIRQIEFCAQVFQLVRGGRVPELRKKATLDVLHEIALLGYLPASVIHCLCTSYVFLRRLEHRLQYLDDAQTHRLPSDVNDCLLIAQGMGFENVTPFLVKLNEVREEVKNHFNALFIQQKYTVEHDSGYLGFLALDKAEMEKRFHDLGFIEAEKWVDRLCEWRESTRYRQLSESAQNRLMGLMPRLLKAASEYSNPDDTLGRILDLIEVLGRREAYFALLDEYPFSLGQVAQICSASQWAADFLAQHPLLLDELLDERLLRALPEVSELRTVLKKKLETADDELELQLDCFAQTKNSHVFHLLAQDLAGLVSIETLGDHLSDLADMILDEMLNFCWQKLLRKPWEDRHFAVIAYGRLGGRELGYASDLDLVFLYEDGRDEAAMIYARLAQRMNAYLTSTGREGSLYEIDLRLRPNGASGLLVSSFMAYEHYLMDEAWVWELQALSRARFVAGDRSIGLEFEQLRRKVLAQPRDLSQLRASVVSMRKKMLKNHANSDDTFDIKHDKGGMVDIEFIVQFLVLGYSHDYPGLLDNAGNIALLQRAAQVNLVTHEEAQAICGVYRDFRSRQHKVKLQG